MKIYICLMIIYEIVRYSVEYCIPLNATKNACESM